MSCLVPTKLLPLFNAVLDFVFGNAFKFVNQLNVNSRFLQHLADSVAARFRPFDMPLWEPQWAERLFLIKRYLIRFNVAVHHGAQLLRKAF